RSPPHLHHFPTRRSSDLPKKVKELLQPSRLGARLSPNERRLWPVIESAGAIVWIRGFPVPQAFAAQSGDAVLIEETRLTPEAERSEEHTSELQSLTNIVC